MLFIFCSRAIAAYLVSAYAKDDALYPKDVRSRALVDHRLQFDLCTLYQRMADYFVSKYIFCILSNNNWKLFN